MADQGTELNGFAVRKEFRTYWEQHPEIGLPIGPESGDNVQEFDNARLVFRNGDIYVEPKEDPGTEGSVTQIPPV